MWLRCQQNSQKFSRFVDANALELNNNNNEMI